ncbi:hypothetical protein N657DRAFT_679239 [Parathielavia appendiculata]|uniref:Asteroid domain-containing protein n=1 Tax=Parathielavia appendiculata TaxID=2587402 RepID=A0AAN6U5C5_9PEZI|nr:hypothetical protein N657DRAFT_679239 [Parathielavia appendiculata]
MDLATQATYASAIYFDSYLPSSKRPERIQRLIKSYRDLIRYHSAFPAGVPKANPRHAIDAIVELFPSAWSTEKQAKPPPPAFLVPAVIDALRDSPESGFPVKLVPGEADGFCAQHVRQHGGTVITSDSDLLVHELGEAGGVVFFADIDADIQNQKLIAPQYRPVDLCRRLSLKPERGLQQLAFEVSRDPHLTVQQAVERVKRNEAVSAFGVEYSDFIEQYLSPEVASELEKDPITKLDPRISELVLRSLRISGVVTPAAGINPAAQDRNEHSLEMYLPFLLDCPSRTSAWEASKPVRELAYAALQSIRGSNIPFVSEMRRLQSVSSGLKVDIPPISEIDELSATLLALLSRIEADLSRPELIWIVLAIYQDITMAIKRGRGYALSLEVLGQDAKGRLDPCSWDGLHFLAQIQATYYSLRMLRQILDFSAYHIEPPSTTMSELAKSLSRLPPWPDFPSPRNFAESITLVREAGGLSCLKNLCEDYEDIISNIVAIQKPESNKTSKKRKAVAPAEEKVKPRSSNPFDLLARGDE